MRLTPRRQFLRRLVPILFVWAQACSTGGAFGQSNATAFFNRLGERALQQQLGFSMTNLQVAPTNAYSAAVHRIFQVTANVIEAMSSNSHPNVFRPQFSERNGGVYLTGFTNDNDVGTLGEWLTGNTNCIPLVIGARRGIPNFNEFTLRTDMRVTRRLQLLRPHTNALPNLTNQMYVMQFSNELSVESWNPYTAPAAFSSEIEISNTLTVTLTNHVGIQAENTFVLQGRTNVQLWPGRNLYGPQGFILPLNSVAVVLSNAAYRFGNNSFEEAASATYEDSRTRPDPFELPEWQATISNHLIYIHKAGTNLLDFVVLREVTTFDLASNLLKQAISPATQFGSVWSNQRRFGSNGPTEGIRAQIAYSQLNGNSSEWTAYSTFVGDRDRAARQFRDFVTGRPTAPLVTETPFNPIARTVQITTWQANDPLIHYHPSDLSPSKAMAPSTWAQQNIVGNQSSITNVNRIYTPWGGGRFIPDPNSFNLSLRDPNVWSADDWNFPIGQAQTPSWLGRVHRGTPWQSIYLKAIAPWTSQWQQQAHYSEHNPTNDWRLALLVAAELSTNAWADRLSVNEATATRWWQLMDGFIVLSNSVSSEELGSRPRAFEVHVVRTNSPQLPIVFSGISSNRAARPGGYFADAASLFAIPVLSTSSPWLNVSDGRQKEFGITDEAYEALPSQLLGLIRADPVAHVSSGSNSVTVTFTGCEPGTYSVEATTNLATWSDLGAIYQVTNDTFSVSNQVLRGPAFFKARRHP